MNAVRYYETTELKKTGQQSVCVYVPKRWNLPTDTPVSVSIWRAELSEDQGFAFVARIRKSNTVGGQRIVIPAEAGMIPGHKVTYFIVPIGTGYTSDPLPDEPDDDA